MIDHILRNIRLFTANLRGLNLKDRKPGARLKKAANVVSLSNSHNAGFFQETRLGPKADSYLKKLLPGHMVFCSSRSFRSSGVATVLSPDILKHFTPHHVPLPIELTGKALVVQLKPKTGGPNLVLVNVYLDFGDDFAAKKRQLELLSPLIPISPHVIVGGDFNFVEDKDRDTSSASAYYDPTDDFLRTWIGFRNKFDLKDVVQLSHTCFDIGIKTGRYRSSRLDRM